MLAFQTLVRFTADSNPIGYNVYYCKLIPYRQIKMDKVTACQVMNGMI